LPNCKKLCFCKRSAENFLNTKVLTEMAGKSDMELAKGCSSRS
jgi:hypothetical protein